VWILLFNGLALGSPPDDALARGYRAKRPTLSGEELTLGEEGGRFLIHYTLSGEDRPEGEDSDDDGVPDMVETVLETLNDAGDYFEEERGYIPLNLDNGVGGSGAIDLYIKTIDANGYASSIKGEGGTSCFMRLAPYLGSQPADVLTGVTAHELHHCVQYAYATGVADWVSEATSTYEQYRYATGITNEYALGYLYYERLQGAGRPLADTDGRFEYAAFLFMKFWVEFAGGTGTLPELWESVSLHDGWETAFDEESLRVFGEDFERSFLEHVTWNAFACARDDGRHYEPSNLPCIIATSVPIQEVDEGPFSIQHEAGPYTASYFAYDGPGSTEVRCEVSRGRGELRLLGLSAQGTEYERSSGRLEPGSELSLRLQLPRVEGGQSLGVLTSLDEEPLEAECVVEGHPPWGAGTRLARGCAVSTGGAGLGGWLSLLVVASRSRRQKSAARGHPCRSTSRPSNR
jgi:hypothetical protein